MQEIGKYLQDERVRQQITLDDLSHHTCISRRMLEALEEGHFADVGTPLLIRGFIRSYCKAVGIDPEPIIDKYSGEIQDLNEQDESIRRYSIWMKKPSPTSRYLLYSVIGCVILVIGFLGASIWLPARSGKNSQIAKAPESLVYPQKDLPEDLPHESGSSPRPSTADVATTSAPAGEVASRAMAGPASEKQSTNRGAQPGATDKSASSGSEIVTEQIPSPDAPDSDQSATEAQAVAPQGDQANPATSVESAVTPSEEGHVLVLTAIDETWLQVQKDSGEKENRLMKAGEERRWEVKKQIHLWLGNAGGIKATWDGRPLKPFGKRGQVVRLQLPSPDYMTN